VFVISGLWHGASLNFVVWGAIHGVLIIIERLTGSWLISKGKDQGVTLRSIFSHVYVLSMVCFAWLFFRANSLSDANRLIHNMLFGAFDFKWVKSLDLDVSIYLAIAATFIIETYAVKSSIINKLNEKPLVFRWAVYTTLIMFVLVYASHGSEEASFIYFQF